MEEGTIFIGDENLTDLEKEISKYEVKPIKIELSKENIEEIMSNNLYTRYSISFLNIEDLLNKKQPSFQSLNEYLIKKKEHPLYKEVGSDIGVLAFGRVPENMEFKDSVYSLNFFNDKHISRIAKKDLFIGGEKKELWNYHFLLYFSKIEDPITSEKVTALILRNGPAVPKNNLCYVIISKRLENINLERIGKDVIVKINEYKRTKEGRFKIINERDINEEEFERYKSIIENFKKADRDFWSIPTQFIDIEKAIKSIAETQLDEEERKDYLKSLRRLLLQQYKSQRLLVSIPIRTDYPLLGTSLSKVKTNKGEKEIAMINIGEIYEEERELRKRVIMFKKEEDDILDMYYSTLWGG